MYDIEDGGFNPQVLFKCEDQAGNTLPSAAAPHLVASRVPGDPFYSSIWEIWTVIVPDGFDVTTLKSKADIKASGFPIRSADIRLDCPVVSVERDPDTDVFDDIPFADAFAMLQNNCSGGPCVFDPTTFHFDLPETEFTKAQTFLITEINPGGAPAAPPSSGTVPFPAITPADGTGDKGNVVPLILQDPFQLESSGPNSTGKNIILFDAEELRTAFQDNVPPRLPEAIEANIAALIGVELLDPSWAPGIRPYQERLALIGRAIFEMVWTPELGAAAVDTTGCLACHSQPAFGGGGRGLYTLNDPVRDRKNPPSLWGGGAKELFGLLIGSDGSDGNAHPFGLQGDVDRMLTFMGRAARNHFDVRTPFVIVEEAAAGDPGALACDTSGDATVSLDEARVCDPDLDGVANELPTGMLIAMTVFGLELPVPDQAVTKELLTILGTDREAIERGGQTFRDVECSSCHKVFQRLSTTNLEIFSPEGPSGLGEFSVAHHHADGNDVNHGDADFLGQAGMRIYADFKRHEMGPGGQLDSSETTIGNTQQLWDVGSDFPLERGGRFGSGIEAVTLAHGGEAQDERDAFDALAPGPKQDLLAFLSAQMIGGKLGEGSGLSNRPQEPDYFFSTSIDAAGIHNSQALQNGVTAVDKHGPRDFGPLATFVPASLGLDALDVQETDPVEVGEPPAVGNILFSVSSNGFAGPVYLEQQRIYSFNPGEETIASVPEASGLGALENLDAVDQLEDGSFAFSTSTNQTVSIDGNVVSLDHRNVYRDTEGGPVTLLFDGAAIGLDDLVGVDVYPSGKVAFSTSQSGSVNTSAGPTSIQPRNVYLYDPGQRRTRWHAVLYRGPPSPALELAVRPPHAYPLRRALPYWAGTTRRNSEEPRCDTRSRWRHCSPAPTAAWRPPTSRLLPRSAIAGAATSRPTTALCSPRTSRSTTAQPSG